jgi:pimeloyl-ACP methyl ester carboxylesterase
MVTLAYDDVAEARQLSFLHGHPFDRSTWRPLLPLSDRFHIVAPDLSGYGRSPARPGMVAMAELARDVWDLLAKLGIDETAVVGLSMGGLVAMEMALAHPQRVWAPGLVATTAQPVTEAEWGERLAMADEVEAVGMDPLVTLMAPRLFGPEPDDELGEFILAMMADNNPQGAASALPVLTSASRCDRCGCPASCARGRTMSGRPRRFTCELVGCLGAPRTLRLPGVGHLPNLERADVINIELLEFLQ